MEKLSTFSPSSFEKKIYEQWEKSGAFSPSLKGKSYIIFMPPPNVTGVLHNGHALFVTLQDTYIRWKRMLGYNALWLPGTDHAGIATQLMVERQVEAEGTSRIKLGRKAFLNRVWAWKEKHGGIILEQMRALGASCDWNRQRFTMDEQSSLAVRAAFINLYHDHLIYRGERIVNWSSGLQTAISDLEVEQKTTNGFLYHIKYKLAESNDYLIIATTRPETIFADVAVAVNPKDSRFKKFHGEKVEIPLTNRSVPIIQDEYVDMEFGTGALKITPGHDVNDWNIGQKHKLPTISVITKEGNLTKEAGEFAGKNAFKARSAVVEKLEKENLLLKKEPYTYELGYCQRSGVVVEPLVSIQWFVKAKTLAGPSLKAAQGENPALRFYPDYWKKTYFEWLENIQDWCISRQLWWGHQIPAWHCKDCKKVTVPETATDPTKCEHCDSKNIEQDPDVLDTWFSSGLWPISTLGWPNKTTDLETFYPEQKFNQARQQEEAYSLMETGSDILFFWVARMVMMCTHFMGGKIPFEDVFLHAMVRDEKGQKMSKTKGNVIDPLDIISEHGTDALRITLLALSGQGRQVNLDPKRIDGYKAFLNKLWNASRFCLMKFEGSKNLDKPKTKELHYTDRWILDRLDSTIVNVNDALKNYRPDSAFQAIYQFTWYDFCDWYLELAKLRADEEATKQTLYYCLQTILKLLHPMAPFITEEIFQHLTEDKLLIKQKFPEHGEKWLANDKTDSITIVEALKSTVEGIRNFRTENQINPKKNISCYIETKNSDLWHKIEFFTKSLAKIEHIYLNKQAPPGPTGSVVTNYFNITIPLTNLVDTEGEIKRLSTEIERTQKDYDFIEKRLANKAFVEKAKPELVEKERARVQEFKEKLTSLKQALKNLENN